VVRRCKPDGGRKKVSVKKIRFFLLTKKLIKKREEKGRHTELEK